MSKRNPLFQGKPGTSKQPEESDDSDSFNESDFSDSDSDSGEESQKSKPTFDDNDEDPLIKLLRESKNKKERNSPPDLKLKSDINDISFHPDQDIIAAANIDGEVKIFRYSNESNKLLKSFQIHKKSVRSIEFDFSGKNLFSASVDKSIKVIDIETAIVKHKFLKAHSSALYKVKPLNENVFVSGDEDGTVKLWDFRANSDKEPVMEHKSFDDFVSDFITDSECRSLVASSGEGTIHSYNIRGKRPDLQSEVYEGEFHSMSLVHRDSKLVAGNSDGKLYMFNWDQFAYHSADFPGHPDAINSVLAVTDNVVLTACEDGTIRAVHLYPHRFLGAVGHHNSEDPVEKLDVSNNGEIVASTSHDNRVKFWNIKYLAEIEYKKTAKPFHNRKKQKVRRKENKMKLAKEKEHQLPSSKRGNARDFFKEIEME